MRNVPNVGNSTDVLGEPGEPAARAAGASFRNQNCGGGSTVGGGPTFGQHAEELTAGF